MDILIVYILDAFTTYDSCLTLIWQHVVLCVLHGLNYNLKAVILWISPFSLTTALSWIKAVLD